MNFIFFKFVDKELFLVFLLSIFTYLYKRIIIFLITKVPDGYLQYSNKCVLYEDNDTFLDSDSDSDSEEFNNNIDNKTSIENLENFNKFLREWEYEIILKLFNIPNVKLNIITDYDKQKIPILFNSIINKPKTNNVITDLNTLNFCEAFLFNITLNKKNLNMFSKLNNNTYDININDIYSLHNKISLLYSLNNKLLSNIITSIFPNYKYLYILYKLNTHNTNNEYKYILIDLHNNYDLIKKKSLLFNLIKL